MDSLNLHILNLIFHKNLANTRNQQYQLLFQHFMQQMYLNQQNDFLSKIITCNSQSGFPNFLSSLKTDGSSMKLSENPLFSLENLLGKKREGNDENFDLKSEKTQDRSNYSCKNHNCSQKFDSIESKFFHELNCKYNYSKQFVCKHKGCNLKFKTKRQLIVHHNKFEEECLNDKNLLIKIVEMYKKTLTAMVKKFSVNKEKLQNSKIYLNLNERNQCLLAKIQDKEFYDSYVGDNIEF